MLRDCLLLCLVFDLLSVVCLLDPKVTWLHWVHMLVTFSMDVISWLQLACGQSILRYLQSFFRMQEICDWM